MPIKSKPSLNLNIYSVLGTERNDETETGKRFSFSHHVQTLVESEVYSGLGTERYDAYTNREKPKPRLILDLYTELLIQGDDVHTNRNNVQTRVT